MQGAKHGLAGVIQKRKTLLGKSRAHSRVKRKTLLGKSKVQNTCEEIREVAVAFLAELSLAAAPAKRQLVGGSAEVHVLPSEQLLPAVALPPDQEAAETCPVSTEGWTRRVHLVRGGGGGKGSRPAARPGSCRARAAVSRGGGRRGKWGARMQNGGRTRPWNKEQRTKERGPAGARRGEVAEEAGGQHRRIAAYGRHHLALVRLSQDLCGRPGHAASPNAAPRGAGKAGGKRMLLVVQDPRILNHKQVRHHQRIPNDRKHSSL